ncbi:type II secretion system GspH family protein [Solirubrobacter phytolaccae]|uniref:Type II secretion system GspH family protein n=1 Tax=Solirubrobacter phytolaccae TaxID=1404360 RepID=A0A9X3SBH8_9ACTN|nr:prepilin-type N-terminal cleavage/methylation domain-containing protein [Solirubrobacter phytolaccae]MDA0181430.1 type II secretion system GspH family protein [Solirubrobacter phytolaccae]
MSRHRLRAEDGFGLVELLVVILIIGVLVAVAIPSLLNQRGKAQDANAKAAVTTAAKAATAYGTEAGAFDDVKPADLVDIEKSLSSARNLTVSGAAKTFTVQVESVGGATFSVSRAADGVLTRDCAPAGTGGCRADADSAGNRW